MRSAVRSGRVKVPEQLDLIAFDLVAEIGLQPSEFADWPIRKVLEWHTMASEKKAIEAEKKRKAAERGYVY